MRGNPYASVEVYFIPQPKNVVGPLSQSRQTPRSLRTCLTSSQREHSFFIVDSSLVGFEPFSTHLVQSQTAVAHSARDCDVLLYRDSPYINLLVIPHQKSIGTRRNRSRFLNSQCSIVRYNRTSCINNRDSLI